jgi:uncharacterized protein YciI
MKHTGEYLYTLHAVRPELLSDGPTPEEEPILQAHFGYLRELAGAGTVILAGRTQNEDEKSLGFVIFRAASPEDARGVMDADPAVRERVMTAELYPYRVAVREGA